jgi:uncharacterized protein YodC (DUF2158 family)
MTEFATGSLVRLKSGGPTMTADVTRGDDVVVTKYWDEGRGEFIRETFMPEMLEMVSSKTDTDRGV